jgi:hypothetical protein
VDVTPSVDAGPGEPVRHRLAPRLGAFQVAVIDLPQAQPLTREVVR